jgi:hypothetical protein
VARHRDRDELRPNAVANLKPTKVGDRLVTVFTHDTALALERYGRPQSSAKHRPARSLALWLGVREWPMTANQVVLDAARDRPNVGARIAAGLRVTVDTVRKWRDRSRSSACSGGRTLPRPGRPRRISAPDRAAVVASACQLSAATGVPLSRWTRPELAAELTVDKVMPS